MDMYNDILFRRRSILAVEKGSNSLDITFVATALENFRALGFIFEANLVERLQTLEVEEFTSWVMSTEAMFKRSTGAHNLNPMYPNFPSQVMDAEGLELWTNAMVHYFGTAVGLRFMPSYEKKERSPLAKSEEELTLVGLAREDSFLEISKALLASKTSLSEQDREDLKLVIKQFSKSLQLILPKVFPHKENLALIAVAIGEEKESTTLLAPYFKGATDVLRLAVALSGGDVSLATNTVFRSMKRSERRLILSFLDQIESPLEDMLRHRGVWIRVGERVHPGDYSKRFTHAYTAFDILRNRPETISTFNRKVESNMVSGTVKKFVFAGVPTDQLCSVLSQRPGEFARRLDHTMRISQDPESVIEAFRLVVSRVSSPLLLQLLTHFKLREEDLLCRVFFPKGQIGKLYSIGDERLKIVGKYCEKVVLICENALKEKFANLPPLGKVYIAPKLSNYCVPLSRRSASKSKKVVARGSRISFTKKADKNTFRFFLWWKEGPATGNIDVDLSASFHTEKWNYIDHISYTNLRSKNLNAVHSGDITSAPNGACEYIDIDLSKAKEAKCRYIVMNIYSYSIQNFVDMPECYAGWMMRSDTQSGEIFEPSTVSQRFDLNSASKIAIPVIVDLVKEELIWCDLALSNNLQYQNNFEANSRGVATLGYAMTHHRLPELATLFKLHAEVRGELVFKVEDADTIFSLDIGITPEHVETISSDYL